MDRYISKLYLFYVSEINNIHSFIGQRTPKRNIYNSYEELKRVLELFNAALQSIRKLCQTSCDNNFDKRQLSEFHFQKTHTHTHTQSQMAAIGQKSVGPTYAVAEW